MEQFEYDILIRVTGNEKTKWILASVKKPIARNLLLSLNKLGKSGWEVVASGDLGSDSRAEIILKRRVA